MAHTRRDAVRLGLVAGVAVGIGGNAAARGQSADAWRQFQRDGSNAGYVPDAAGPRSVHKIGEFAAVAKARAPTSPVAAGGTIFFGDSEGHLYAVESDSGAERWTAEFDGAVSGTPLAANGTVYATGLDGTVRAFDPGDGEQLWRYDVTAGSTASRLTAAGGRLIVAASEGVRALALEDGSEVWNSEVGATTGVAVANGTVYATETGTSRLVALDAKTGDVEWRTVLDGRPTPESTPTVVDGRVYVGGRRGRLFACSTADGETAWTFDTETDAPIGTSPAVAGERVVFAVDQSAGVFCVDRTTGTQRWRFNPQHPIIAPPIAVGDVAYFVHRDNRFFGLDLADGELQFTADVDSEAAGALAYAGGTFLVLSEGGILHAFGPGEKGGDDTDTGQSEGSLGSDGGDGPVQTPPETTAEGPSRGFFTNSDGADLGPLGDPFVLTVGGFLLSVVGIMKDLLRGG